MFTRFDFSQYVAHFTKDGTACVTDDNTNPANNWNNMSAKQKLLQILEQQSISATTIPWTRLKAVCFTECVWGSLLAHANQYSPYGIGFFKREIFRQKGNPVFYVRPSLYKKANLDNNPIKVFTTPFKPSYSRETLPNVPDGKPLDFSHEREWRVPSDMSFNYSDIQFLILNSTEDLGDFERYINQIGVDRVILMENYKKIESLWPVHKI